MTHDLLSLGTAALSLDVTIAAWLHAKQGQSGSARTHVAYRDTLAAFRSVLQQVGWDLDGDARHVGLALQAWVAGRYRAGARVPGTVAPATYNLRIAIVSSFFAYARKRGLVAVNPVELVDRRTVAEYGTATALAPTEARAGLQAIDRSTPVGLRDYALLSVAMTTGRRLAEIAAWRWGDVQLVSDLVLLHTRKAKGGKVFADELPGPTSRTLMAWLRAHYGSRLGDLSAAAPLWVNLSRAAPGPDLPISPRAIADVVHARLGVNPHATRHTFAHSMEAVGAPASDIQQRLGHSSLATTGKYLAALNRARNPHAAALAALFIDE